MSEQVDQAWMDYQADALTDPMYRYSHDHKAIFRAGFMASQKKHVGIKESVWITAPAVPEEVDPE